jgi:hypothetical protein
VYEVGADELDTAEGGKCPGHPRWCSFRIRTFRLTLPLTAFRHP